MFSNARSFNQDISRWDISRVQKGAAPMRHMFRDSLALSECNKHKMNLAWSSQNDKWPYASAWRGSECPPPSPAPAPPARARSGRG